MAEYPLSFVTGLGWEAYYQTIGNRYATHSVYLDRLYNLGTVGLALFMTSYVSAIAKARRALRNAPDEAAPFLMATVIGMTSFMIAMAFSDINEAATYVWTFAGLAMRVAVTTSMPQRDHRI
jgi:O-antigen ligase